MRKLFARAIRRTEEGEVAASKVARAGALKVGFLNGSDRHDRVVLSRAGETATTHNVGSTDVARLLPPELERISFHITRSYFRQSVRHNIEDYDCLINLVTDPDQNPKVLENIAKLLRGFGGRVINRPDAVLRSTREQVAQRLAGIPGLHVPGSIRLKTTKPHIVRTAIEKAGLRFPVIARLAGTHTGNILGRFDSLEEMQGALREGEEHNVTEFVDFRSSDGLYRKYRIFFFGPRLVLRHMIVSDEWNVHARDRLRFMKPRPELREEEARLLASASRGLPEESARTLETVRQRIGLDFFGLDFTIARGGKLVLFEANATMNFFPFLAEPEFAYVTRCLKPARLAFAELVGLPPALSRGPASPEMEAAL